MQNQTLGYVWCGMNKQIEKKLSGLFFEVLAQNKANPGEPIAEILESLVEDLTKWAAVRDACQHLLGVTGQDTLSYLPGEARIIHFKYCPKCGAEMDRGCPLKKATSNGT